MQKRLFFISLLTLLEIALISIPPGMAQSTKKKVIFDQDTDGVIGGNADPLIMFLQSENIEVLGVTPGTGNGWLKQETADILRTLELMGRSDVPVYMGAEFPLVQTREEMWLRSKIFGGHRLDPFLGAYSEYSQGPNHVVEPYGGFAKTKPQPGHASEFIIRTVRANPNQVTLFCGGALTNVALAISIAPDIVPLTKELVFMGTSPAHHSRTVNVIYDPEAAKIALRAPWPKVTLITVDLAEKVHQSPELAEAIVKGQLKPIADAYNELVWKPYQKNPNRSWFRMPDEIEAAYVIDPSIFTETRRMYVDINTIFSPDYGGSMFWEEHPKAYGGMPWPEKPSSKAENPFPTPNAKVANVLWDFNTEKFKALYLKLMTAPLKGR
jgi:purine nucleosidase